jgi:hypothetical protein
MFLRSASAKERLRPALSAANLEKTIPAPAYAVTVPFLGVQAGTSTDPATLVVSEDNLTGGKDRTLLVRLDNWVSN